MGLGARRAGRRGAGDHGYGAGVAGDVDGVARGAHHQVVDAVAGEVGRRQGVAEQLAAVEGARHSGEALM